MPNVFLISDTHFGHKGVCKFLRADGVTKLRPWDDPNEMDEVLVDRWNSVVKSGDKVYHLGDVFINRKSRFIMDRLNGKKVLIKGNHDIFKLSDYLPYFYDIRAYHVLDMFIMSHVPIHPDNLGRFKGNVHGHLHEHVVRNPVKHDCVCFYPCNCWTPLPDPRYKSVCVEQINYTPLEFSVVQQYYQNLR